MKAFYTILLLIVSNIFMTFAWYGHLKLQETKVISNWPLYAVVLFSWVIALAEYSCQVPANRIGFLGNGGPFSLMLPGFAVQGIGLITENGVLGLGRSAVVFAPRSFGSTAYEALYGNDFM